MNPGDHDNTTTPSSPPPPPPRKYRGYCLYCSYELSAHADANPLEPGHCPECGKPFDPRNHTTYSAKPYRFSHAILPIARCLPTWILTVALLTCILLSGCILNPIYQGYVFYLSLAATGLSLMVCYSLPFPRHIRRIGTRRTLYNLLLLLVMYVTLWTQWPTRITMHLHKSALSQLAAQIEHGQIVSFPQSLWPLTITGGERWEDADGPVILWLTVPHGYHACGLVHASASEVEYEFTYYSHEYLTHDWQIVYDD